MTAQAVLLSSPLRSVRWAAVLLAYWFCKQLDVNWFMIGCSTSISSSSTLKKLQMQESKTLKILLKQKLIVLVSKTFGYGWGGWQS